MCKIKSKSLSSNIGSCLSDMISKNLTKSCKHEMTRRVKCRCLNTSISKPSLEFPCCSGTREFLVLLKCNTKSFHIDSESVFLRKLKCHLYWKSIRIKKCKCLRSSNLSYFLSTVLECNLESINDLLEFTNSIFECF